MEGEVTVKDAGKAQVVTDPESDKADTGEPQRTIALDDGYGDALLLLGTGTVKRTGLDENGNLATDYDPGFPSDMPPGLTEIMADFEERYFPLYST
ncbi:hypothetical protein PtrSN002B_005688 [Pyrenophora tritici-repentis]|nr:hypothetical protein PtrV1_08763 [Pyrenophora tritici-repentis]KAG9383262.1 hypothetical protein A1F94_005173 [Pyrenophora tritici-repentis]KAI1551373.1 hypothetical protein PtrSN002B_005688 [Pyrenophora tritici-repentis]KAI1597137.1 hypothetical protein PtrEW13061_001596 [Pyrenophora tritici-repentis]PZD28669.1 hypothetical protein A1F96_05730 [Pyrenophora tritici-repentis]